MSARNTAFTGFGHVHQKVFYLKIHPAIDSKFQFAFHKVAFETNG